MLHARWCPIMNEPERIVLEEGDLHLEGGLFAGEWLQIYK
jgi:hypothetical protein